MKMFLILNNFLYICKKSNNMSIFKNFSSYDINIEKGTVYSLHYNKNRFLTLSETPDGYIRCGVVDDRGNHYNRLHQVIYCAVNGVTIDEFPVDENGYKYEIHHKDNNKKNNHPSNLFLVSKKDQMNDKITLQTLKKASSKRMENKDARIKISRKLKNRKDKSKQVYQKDMLTGKLIASFPSLMEAYRQTKVNFGHISECCRGLRPNAGGYLWSYHLI